MPVWDATAVEKLSYLSPGIPVDLDRRPDVAVVGGGVLGLAIGVMCVRAGIRSVSILETGRLAGGPSGRAGGVLAPEPHVWTDPRALVELGRRSLRLARELDAEWDGTLDLSDLDCLLVGKDGSDAPMPFDAPVDVLGEHEVHEREPALAGVDKALLIRRQARVNPVHFAAGLAARAGTVATGVEVGERSVRAGRVTTLATTAGAIHPGTVVFATGVAPRPEVAVPHHLVKGHLAATEPVPFGLESRVVTPQGGVLPLGDGRLLTGGTLDEGDRSPVVRPEVIRQLKRRLEEVIPEAASVRFSHAWCCFRPATPDRLPLIDRVPDLENAWFTSGHYRTGLLLALATADALVQWIITGSQPEHVAPFGLARFE